MAKDAVPYATAPRSDAQPEDPRLRVPRAIAQHRGLGTYPTPYSPPSAPSPSSASASNWQSYETVFTNAKAGMDGVDKERVKKVVFQLSKNSAFFENEQRKQAASTLKIEDMQRRASSLSQEQLSGFTRQADAQLIRLEAQRDLSHVWLHVDMDAFFAAVEERDDPSLKGKPMAVGGTGMISTANYVARKFGVRSAMPGFIAKELCPQLVFVRPNFDKYSKAAEETRQIFRKYDPDFEAGSLDEAYLDVTCVSESRGLTGAEIATEIRTAIRDTTSLTCSVGIAPNRRLAKICSDINKPDGQYEVPAQRAAISHFMETLPIRKVSFIGKVQEQMLNQALGIQACGDLLKQRGLIVALFSEKASVFYLEVGLGLGMTEHRKRTGGSGVGRKGISCERTFRAITTLEDMERKVSEIAIHLADDMAREQLHGRNLTLKLKSSDFKVHTRAYTSPSWLFTADAIEAAALKLLRAEASNGRLGPLRLIGLRMSHLAKRGGGEALAEPGQPTLASFMSSGPSAKDDVDKICYLEESVHLQEKPMLPAVPDPYCFRGREQEYCAPDEVANDLWKGEVGEVSASGVAERPMHTAPNVGFEKKAANSSGLFKPHPIHGNSSSKAPWTCRVCTLAGNPHYQLRCTACNFLRSATSADVDSRYQQGHQKGQQQNVAENISSQKHGLSRLAKRRQQQHSNGTKQGRKASLTASIDRFLVRKQPEKE